jgi:PBSX family phage terminase large subunit
MMQAQMMKRAVQGMKARTPAHIELLSGLGKFRVHRVLSGPFGCGKTHTSLEAFGVYLLTLNSFTDKRFDFVLAGKTQKSVKKNLCNPLSKLYGSDFRFDGSRRHGRTRDAVLFGHTLHIIGLNDVGAEARIRGLTDIMGVLHDEVSLCDEEQFNLLFGRIRGAVLPAEVPSDYRTGWYLGTTNPSHPAHWVLKKQNIKLVNWKRSDAIWDGADEWYEKELLPSLQGNDAQIKRFYEGLWVSEDDSVYAGHLTNHHILRDVDIDYDAMQKIFLGIDYGDAHWTAITVICKTVDGEYVVSEEFGFKRTAPSDIVAGLQKGLAKYGLKDWTAYVDPSASALIRELQKSGVKAIKAKNDISAGIAVVRNLLAKQELFIRAECAELVKEMYGYRYKNPEASDAVLAKDDHFVDALRYGIYTEHGLR